MRLNAKLTGFLIVAATVLSACVGDTSGTQSAEHENGATMVRTFEGGCLTPDRSMRSAHKVFDANGYTYTEPFRSSSINLSRAVAAATLRMPTITPVPTRSDRRWDTKFLGCQLSRVGVFAPLIHADVVQALARQGFSTITPIATPAATGPSIVTGTYARGGIRFKVTLEQRIALNPSSRGNGNVTYVRGNSKTRLSIDSIDEPPGYRFPEGQ